MSLYGYPRDTTPFLQSFAEESVIYQQARSPGMSSHESHTSIFTGLEVEEHGAHNLKYHTVREDTTIWHELSEDLNYKTGAFTNNPNISSGDSNLNKPFEKQDFKYNSIFTGGRAAREFQLEYDHHAQKEKYYNFYQFCLESRAPTRTFLNGLGRKLSFKYSSPRFERSQQIEGKYFVDSFLKWVDQIEQSRPWAAFLNLMDAHHPYYPKPRYDNWGGGEKLQRKQCKMSAHPLDVYGGNISWEEWKCLESLYDGSIRQLDQTIKYMIEQLRNRGILDNTLVVITSDHGETFGESSRSRPHIRLAGHITGLHESLLHIPLIIRFPDGSPSGIVESVATLSKYPDVVRSTLDGSNDFKGFVPESKPVVASGKILEKTLEDGKRIAKYRDDPRKFAGTVRAVFEEKNGKLLKHLSWGEDTVTVEIEDAHNSYIVESSSTLKKINSTFSKLNKNGVLIEFDEGVSESTKQHLEDLGYM